jgi:hypothetical protein
LIGLSELDLQLEGVKPARVNINRELRSNRSETSRSITNEDENTINREENHSVLQKRTRTRQSAPAVLQETPRPQLLALAQAEHPSQENHSNEQPVICKRKRKRKTSEVEAIILALDAKRKKR